jgi:nucleoid DNA-binding protein
MNKTELIEKVKEKLGDQVHAESVVDLVFSTISDTLCAGEKVEVDDFGTFQAIVPNDGEENIIFKPERKLDDPED